jgi:hypothetical protein
MKQVGRIRRPFQAQSIALVMLCRFLAEKFKSIGKSAVTVENVNSLDAYVVLLSTKTISSDLDIFTGHSRKHWIRYRLLPRPSLN